MNGQLEERFRCNGKRLGLLLGLMVCLSASTGAARVSSAGQPENLFDLSIEELLQVKITGVTLTDETIVSVPSAVSVFEGEEITNLGVRSLEELLNFVPGYQSFNTGESGHSAPFSSRGRKTGTTSREVLVLLNGQRIDTAVYGGTPFALPQLSLRMVDRAEVIRGTGSALYGSNAFLGVVNLVTYENLDLVNVEIGQPDSYDVFGARSFSRRGISGQLFFRGFERREEEKRVRGTFSGDTIDVQEMTNGHDIGGMVKWKGSEFEFLSSVRSAPGFFVLGNAEETNFGYDTEFHQGTFRQELKWNEEHVTSVDLSGRLWKESLEAQGTAAGAFSGISDPNSDAPLLGVFHGEEVEGSIGLTHNWVASERLHWVFGAECRYSDLKRAESHVNFNLLDLYGGILPVRSSETLAYTVPTVGDESRTARGVFAQGQYTFWTRHGVTAGLRYDHYSGSGSKLSPRAGWVWQVSDEITLKLAYGEAYRVASFLEQFSMNNPILEGNPDLDPETVKTWDLIGIWHNENHVFTIGYFRNRFEAAIVNGQIGDRRTFVNSGDEENSGVELEYLLKLENGWYLRASATRFWEVLEDAYREADVLGSVALNYSWRSWNFTVSGIYQGERERVDEGVAERVRIDPVVEMNLSMRKTWGRWTLHGHVVNLLNRSNEAPPQSQSTGQNIPLRGRSLRLGLEYQF